MESGKEEMSRGEKGTHCSHILFFHLFPLQIANYFLLHFSFADCKIFSFAFFFCRLQTIFFCSRAWQIDWGHINHRYTHPWFYWYLFAFTFYLVYICYDSVIHFVVCAPDHSVWNLKFHCLENWFKLNLHQDIKKLCKSAPSWWYRYFKITKLCAAIYVEHIFATRCQ